MSQLSKIPLDKLEKIHYTQLKIIALREKEGRTEGRQIKAGSVKEAVEGLTTLLKNIFDQAGGQKEGDMLGLHYYVAILNNLPLDKVRTLEIETGREIKRKKELIRQRLDAGNLDKVIKEELKK